MKKCIKYVIGFIFVIMFITGCNYQMFDLTYTFDYGYISLPNGECVEGKIDSWIDYDDGDQIQIVIDGVTYLTDTTRCVLVKTK